MGAREEHLGREWTMTRRSERLTISVKNRPEIWALKSWSIPTKDKRPLYPRDFLALLKSDERTGLGSGVLSRFLAPAPLRMASTANRSGIHVRLRYSELGLRRDYVALWLTEESEGFQLDGTEKIPVAVGGFTKFLFDRNEPPFMLDKSLTLTSCRGQDETWWATRESRIQLNPQAS